MKQQRIDRSQNTAVAQPLRVLLVGQIEQHDSNLEGHFHARSLHVRHALTAGEALIAAQSFAPDILVLHWQALDVTGPKFLRMLTDEKLLQTPVVFVNAAPKDLSHAETCEAVAAGADLVFPAQVEHDAVDAALKMAERHRRRDLAATERLRRVTARLDELQERFDSLDNDLLEARKLQQSLLRDRFVELKAGALSAILRSSGHVGGDLVGHFPINDETIGFFALDVSGHGVSSALMTARLAGYLSASHPRQNIALERAPGGGWRARSPARALADLNELVMEDLETDHYFTMLLGSFRARDGYIRLSQAGHPHPALQRANGQVEFVGSGGLPVGLIPGADYANMELTLGAGEKLLVLSDGFTESTLEDGSFLAESGLIRLLAASRALSGSALLEALVWDLSQMIGDEDFQDDLSGILLERYTAPKA